MATYTRLSGILVVTVALLVSLPVVMMLFAWPMMGVGWWMHGPADGGRPAGPGGFGEAMPTQMLDFWLVGLLLVVGIRYLLYRALSGTITTRARRTPAGLRSRRTHRRGVRGPPRAIRVVSAPR
jgi:hypothetical protein